MMLPRRAHSRLLTKIDITVVKLEDWRLNTPANLTTCQGFWAISQDWCTLYRQARQPVKEKDRDLSSR